MALAFAANKQFTAASTTQRCSRPCLVHRARPSRAAVVAKAAMQQDGSRVPAVAIITSALAASLVCFSGIAPPAAIAANPSTVGGEITKKLVEGGTPGAAKPDSMKTNIPFQAPGVNAPPRGRAQERGTNAKTAVNNAAKQSKKNDADRDAAPFGIGRGPLVRDAKKMGQPGKLSNIRKEAAASFNRQSSTTKAAKEIDEGKPVDRGFYKVYDKAANKLGSTESLKQ